MPAPSFEQILDEVATAEAALAQNGAGPRSSPGFWSAFARIVPPRSATAGGARKKPVTPEPMDLPVQATTRMQIANALIDQALKKILP